MKLARMFAAVFGAIGVVLLAGTVLLCLTSLDAPVKMKDVPAEAMDCAQELMDALAAGDFAAAGARIYGQPDLGMAESPEEELGRLVWDAYVDSISYEFISDCYAGNGRICRDAAITMLDIPSVTDAWNGSVHTALTARIQEAEDQGDLKAIYDENNEFRADLVDQVIRDAVADSLEGNLKTTTTQVTLQMICRDGIWWVVPDEALLTSLFGGLA